MVRIITFNHENKMDNCITISDDEEVEILDDIINVEPIVIDLTESEVNQPSPPSSASPASEPTKTTTPPPPRHPEFTPNEEFISSETTYNRYHGAEDRGQNSTEMDAEFSSNTDPVTESQSIPQPRPQAQPEQPSQEITPEQITHPGHPSFQEQSPRVELREEPQVSNQVRFATSEQQPTISDQELMISLKNLGNEKFRYEAYDEAIRVYKRAYTVARKIDDKGMSAILHFNLAMCYYRLRLYDQAASECAEAVKIDDGYLKAHRLRGEIYEVQDKFEEAVICYEHLHEKDKQNRDFAILLSRARDKALNQVKRRDWYYYSQLLGLRSNSTKEDLKRAFRKQALTHHPDRHSGADIVTRKIQEKKFKDACEAHAFMQLRLGYNR